MSVRGTPEKDFITSEITLQSIISTLSKRTTLDITLQNRGDVSIRVGSVTAVPSDASHWQFRGHITKPHGSIPYTGELSTTTGVAWIQTERQK